MTRISTKWPKISVILGNYNYGVWLERAVCSVLDQHYPNLELLVIDDGSTDHSVEILKKYQAHFNYFNPRSNQGHYSWVKEGSEKATGDWLNWLCSDDSLAPDSLWKLGEAFRKNNPDVVTGEVLRWGPNQEVESRTIPAIPVNFSSIFVGGMVLPQPATFIKRSLFVQHLPPPGLVDILVDTALYLNLWMTQDKKLTAESIPEVLAHVQVHPGAQTFRQGRQTKQEIKSIYDFLWKNATSDQKPIIKERLNLHEALDRLEEAADQPQSGLRTLWDIFMDYPRILYQRSFWGAVKKKL